VAFFHSQGTLLCSLQTRETRQRRQRKRDSKICRRGEPFPLKTSPDRDTTHQSVACWCRMTACLLNHTSSVLSVRGGSRSLWSSEQKGTVWDVIRVGHLNITARASRQTHKGPAPHLTAHCHREDTYIMRPPLSLFTQGDKKRKDILEKCVQKTVCLSPLPQGVVRELNSVHSGLSFITEGL